MTRRSPMAPSPKTYLPVLLAAISLLLPSVAHAAKPLASEALAAAIATCTLEQARQELLTDLHQRQRYEFDEDGMERLGRSLLAQGNQEQGVEVLQLNQAVHQDSPRAANALPDGFSAAGEDIQARVYYDMALNLDPENDHARKASADQGSAEKLAMEAMAQLEAYQQDPSANRAAAPQAPSRQPQSTTAPTAPKHESEYCEVLHRFNESKKIEGSQVRTRVEGHYGASGESLRTWNVESACGEFLIAVPLWADVSPPVMGPVSANEFEDATGGRWVFEIGGDGGATGLTYTSPDGRTTEMKRLGDPKSLD